MRPVAAALRRGQSIAAAPATVEVVRSEPRTLIPARNRWAPPADAPQPADWLTIHRIVSLVGALALLWPESKAWNDIVSAPLPGISTIALTGGTLVLASLIATTRTEPALERLDRWLLVLGLLVVVAWAGSILQFSSGYSTDEAAFVHSAADRLLHGHDPYGANLLPSLGTFGVPSRYWTYTMSGGAVSTLGYPALPVLVATPFVALFGSGQAVQIAEILVLLIGTSVAFAALPRPWRPLAVVICVGFPALTGFAVAGLNAVLLLPPLIVVARQWANVGERGSLSSPDRVAAVALGLGLSTNQLAWFVAPFILVGIVLLRSPELGARRALAVATRYGGVAAVTSAALNIPFIIWGAAAWWQGVVAPLSQHAIPYGQGLVGLTVFLGIGGGAVDAYTYTAAALYLGLFMLFATQFRRLARSCFLLPVIALYVSGRSLAEYWLLLMVPILIGAIAVDGASLRAASQLTWPRRLRPRLPAKIVAPALFVPAAALLAVALLTPPPLSIQILRVQLNQPRTAVARLWVAVRNASGAQLRPHFAINSTGQASPFWRIVTGPSVLAPGARVRYVLDATEVDPLAAGPFLLQAVTESPRTISSSGVFKPSFSESGSW